jgi:hypothetical protein
MKKIITIFFGCLLLTTALQAVPVDAQQLLYAPPPPRGSAQVRVINGTAASLTLQPNFSGSLKLGTGTLDRVSSYQTVPDVTGRTYTITSDKFGTVNVTLAHDHQISIILTVTDKVLHAYTISDDVEFNQVRSRLRFYNGAAECTFADLQLRPGLQAIFSNVKAGEEQMRAVNPVEATVSTRCGSKTGPDVSLSGMQVGRGYSLWLLAPGDELIAFVTPDGNSLYMP